MSRLSKQPETGTFAMLAKRAEDRLHAVSAFCPAARQVIGDGQRDIVKAAKAFGVRSEYLNSVLDGHTIISQEVADRWGKILEKNQHFKDRWIKHGDAFRQGAALLRKTSKESQGNPSEAPQALEPEKIAEPETHETGQDEAVTIAQTFTARESFALNLKIKQKKTKIATKKRYPSSHTPATGGNQVEEASSSSDAEERKTGGREPALKKPELRPNHLAMLKARRNAVEKGDKNIAGSIIERIIGEDANWSEEARALQVGESTFSNIIHQKIGISAEVLDMMQNEWPGMFAKRHGERWETNKDEYFKIIADTHPVRTGMPTEFGDKNTIGPVILRISYDSGVVAAEAASDLGISASAYYQLARGKIEISDRMAALIVDRFLAVFQGEKYQEGWERNQEEFFREAQKLPGYESLTAKNAALEQTQEILNETDTPTNDIDWARAASKLVRRILADDNDLVLDKDKIAIGVSHQFYDAVQLPVLKNREIWNNILQSEEKRPSILRSAILEVCEIYGFKTANSEAVSDREAQKLLEAYSNAAVEYCSKKLPKNVDVHARPVAEHVAQHMARTSCQWH